MRPPGAASTRVYSSTTADLTIGSREQASLADLLHRRFCGRHDDAQTTRSARAGATGTDSIAKTRSNFRVDMTLLGVIPTWEVKSLRF